MTLSGILARILGKLNAEFQLDNLELQLEEIVLVQDLILEMIQILKTEMDAAVKDDAAIVFVYL